MRRRAQMPITLRWIGTFSILPSSGLVIGVVVSQAGPMMTTPAGNVPQNVNFAIRGEIAQIFLSAHGIKFSTSRRWRAQQTE
jgi:hypothetical protein